jgi:uncharacterized protein (TIGR00288 family)
VDAKEIPAADAEPRTAVLVDCDNVSPDILEYALLMAAQFGRIVLRRGYGNLATLSNKWQEAMVRQAFTPCLQYQYVAGKNTADIALVLDAQEALFDGRVDSFCLVTSDSDFTYLCRKLRERGGTVYIVGKTNTPEPLRNACDQFFEWKPEVAGKAAGKSGASVSSRIYKTEKDVVKAIAQRIGDAPDGKLSLSEVGQYLRRTDPAFSHKNFGHSSLLGMVNACSALAVKKENGGHWLSLNGEPKAGESADNPGEAPASEIPDKQTARARRSRPKKEKS